MLSKFSASGVFASRVDYFCLVCESRLRDEGDAVAHIAKPVHTKKFDLTEYFGNEQECVRKIKKWYLCELCNLVLPTAARVRLHITEATHVENRVSGALQRKGSCVVAFSSVQLDDRAWNGIVDDTCAICNTEFDDEHIHRNETSHILKLIQSKVEFDENQNLYRRIDESTFHCLTCNMVFAFSSIDKHFCENEHKNLYQCCCDNFKMAANTAILESIDIPNAIENNKNQPDKKEIEVVTKVPDTTTKSFDDLNSTDTNSNKKTRSDERADVEPSTTNTSKTKKNNMKANDVKQTNKSPVKSVPVEICETLKAKKTEENIKKESSILDFLDIFQKNDININFEFGTAVCKKCSKQLDFNSLAVENHIQEHAKIKNEKSNTIAIQHISGLEVTKNVEAGNKETSLYTTTVYKKDKQELIKDTVDAKKTKELSQIFDVDELEKYAKQNYMIYIPDENKVYCNICDTNMAPSLKTLKEHVGGINHKKKLNEVQVFNDKSKSKQVDKEVNLAKIPLNYFIVSAVTIQSLQTEVIINERLCVTMFSFSLVFNQNNTLTCLVCECNLFTHNFNQHMNTAKHISLLERSLVVVEHDHDTEFIREFKPGCYHCGHCNVACSSWDAMESHLQTTAHKEYNTKAQWRLQQLLPELAKRHKQRQMQEKFMMEMLFPSMFRGRNMYYNSDSD